MWDTEPTPPPRNPVEEDLRTRWMPSAEQVAEAVALLRREVSPGALDRYVAVVPLAQPGKQFGIWQLGQPVETVPGVWLGENTSGESQYPLRDAQVAAEKAAARWLVDRGLDGTVSAVFISADETAAVFESILDVATLQSL